MAPIFNPSDSSNNLTPLIAALSEAITNLKVQLPVFRQTAPEPYEVPINQELVKIIAPLDDEQPRRITVSNQGQAKVYLFFGQLPPAVPSIATPWMLNPGDQYIDDRDGGYGVWGFSPEGVSLVVVGIQYPDGFSAFNEDDMAIPLNVELILGTGENFAKSFPTLLGFDAHDLKKFLDSDQGFTGHKLFRLNSFQPGSEYEFNLEISGIFDLDDSVDNPFEVFLLDVNKITTAFVSAMSGWGDFPTVIHPLTVGWIKTGAFVKSLPPSGGKFTLKPSFSRFVGHFSVYTKSAGAQGAIIDGYNSETNTFSLIGH